MVCSVHSHQRERDEGEGEGESGEMSILESGKGSEETFLLDWVTMERKSFRAVTVLLFATSGA